MDDKRSVDLAKIAWTDPHTGVTREFVLQKGATATIGRSSSNDIHIPEQHVSRQHAVISYRSDTFVISDLGSANGTFVNGIKIKEPHPIIFGDDIRLYVPTLKFLSATSIDADNASQTGDFITIQTNINASLTITNGSQEGQVLPLTRDDLKIGRMTDNAIWDIQLQDITVSRPHARLFRDNTKWMLLDLGSANGTTINSTPVTGDTPVMLRPGDTISFGATMTLFRIGFNPANRA